MTDMIKCSGCGIKIPCPGENADPDTLLCDGCYEDEYGLEEIETIVKKLYRVPVPDVEHYPDYDENL